ncbi:MAG: DUF6036 family nucleotidyltransferase [Pirellulales bacterium]
MMQKLVTTAAAFQEFCVANSLPFCFVGGLAVQAWGESRVTLDVDAAVYTGFENDDAVVSLLLEAFSARRPDAAEFALRNRVLLLKSPYQVDIDVALAGLDYEKRMIERSNLAEYLPGVSLRICSAEDLIVLKAFANRRRDWADIEGILARQGDALDWTYIETSLEPLAVATDRPELMDALRTLRDEMPPD